MAETNNRHIILMRLDGSRLWSYGVNIHFRNQVANQAGYFFCIVGCDNNQIIEWSCEVANADALAIYLLGYIEQD